MHEHPRQTNLDLCLKEIEQRGYAAQSYLLDAKAYGLPQHRRRIYIICLDFHNKQLSVSANDFFASVKVLLRKLYVPAPPAVTRMVFTRAVAFIFPHLLYVSCI